MAETLSSIFGNTEDDLAEPPGSAMPVPVGSPPASLAENLTSVRQQELYAQQEQSLRQHAQYRAGLEHAQSQVDLRAQDLEIANRALGIFDTGAETSVREYRYKHLVTKLGIDPKSETSKDLWKLIKGLSPDSALAVRQNLAGQISGANPGQVIQAFTGVLRGEIDPLELFSATRPQPQGREAFYAQYGPPMMAGASDAAPPTPTMDPDDVASSIVSQAGDAKTAPDLRQVHPQIAKMYGLDPNKPWRNADVISRGYDGPMSMKDQEKWIKERATVVDDGTKVLDSFIVMEYITRGRPETLRIPGFTVPIPGAPVKVDLPTGSELYTGFLNLLHGWGMTGPDTSSGPPVAQGAEGTPTSRLQGFAESAAPLGEIGNRDKFMGKKIARRLTDDIKGTPLEQLPRPDEDVPGSADRARENTRLTAAIESNAAELVFRMGRMAGQSGHAFSDKDRDIFAQQFAGSSDPGARLAAMQTSAGKMFADMDPALVNALANRIIARNNPEMTKAYLDSPVVPQNVKDAIRARADAASQQPTQTQQQPTQQQQAPTQQQQRSELNSVPGIVVTEPRQSSPTQQQTPAQPRTIEEERAQLQRAQDEAQKMIVGRYNLAIKRYEMEERIAQENRDYRARQEARQARKDAEERRDKIQAAFARIASLLAGSVRGGSVGGSVNMGGDQDASAFKIGQRQSRAAPPTPPQARSGYENVRRLRGAGQ